MRFITFDERDYLEDAYPLLETYLKLEGEVSLVRIKIEAERIGRTQRRKISAYIVEQAYGNIQKRKRRIIFVKLLDLFAGGLIGAVISAYISSVVGNTSFDSSSAFPYLLLGILIFFLGLLLTKDE